MRWRFGHTCDLQIGNRPSCVRVGSGRMVLGAGGSVPRQLLPFHPLGLSPDVRLGRWVREATWGSRQVHGIVAGRAKACTRVAPWGERVLCFFHDCFTPGATYHLAHYTKLLFITTLIRGSHRLQYLFCTVNFFEHWLQTKKEQNNTSACQLQCLLASCCTAPSRTTWAPEAIKIVFV